MTVSTLTLGTDRKSDGEHHENTRGRHEAPCCHLFTVVDAL
jgi:hypothetical protein